MSLSRAFTTRRLKLGGDGEGGFLPRRSNTTKASNPELRSKISGPVQLLHTTNMLSYNAPDIPRAYRSNSGSSRSEDDSDMMASGATTPLTSPDVGPGDDCTSPEPNHLSCYFAAAGQQQSTATRDANVPAIPRRSPSHTKQSSFEALARKRSTSRMSRDSEHSMSSRGGQTFSRTPSVSTRASSASHPSTPVTPKTEAPPIPSPITSAAPPRPQRVSKEQHPFGQELAQVTELAEEYSAGHQLNKIDEEDVKLMETQNLCKFSADDYLSAIQDLTMSFFPERKHTITAPAPLWI